MNHQSDRSSEEPKGSSELSVYPSTHTGASQARPGEVSILLAGDVMLGRLVSNALRSQGPAYVWGDTLPLLSAGDLTIANLECVVAHEGVGQPWSRWRKVFHFKADPLAIEALKLAGVDCVCLANNHVLDYEEDALLEMLALLEGAGIQHTGAGRNAEQASSPTVLHVRGLTVGVVAFTDNEPGWVARHDNPGTNWVEVSLQAESLAPVRECIVRARAAGAAVVVFSMHWGPNMVERPTPLFRDFAHAVVEAGADVFFGHSAHLFQGIEIYQGRPIIYDAGDFVDDYAVDPRLRNDRGLLFRLLVQPAQQTGVRVRRIKLVPVSIARCQVNIARGAEQAAIAAHIKSLSSELGAAVQEDWSGLWLDLP